MAGCQYDEAWVGACGDAAVTTDPIPLCEEHEGKRCGVCGDQAVKGCHATRGLVCGRGLCEEHGVDDCPHFW